MTPMLANPPAIHAPVNVSAFARPANPSQCRAAIREAIADYEARHAEYAAICAKRERKWNALIRSNPELFIDIRKSPRSQPRPRHMKPITGALRAKAAQPLRAWIEEVQAPASKAVDEAWRRIKVLVAAEGCNAVIADGMAYWFDGDLDGAINGDDDRSFCVNPTRLILNLDDILTIRVAAPRGS